MVKTRGSLDFWVPGMTVCSFVVSIFGAMMGIQENRDDRPDEELRWILDTIDHTEAAESTQYYKALRGHRLRTAYENRSHVSTLPLLCVAAFVLGGLRFVSQYLQSCTRSVRLKARPKALRDVLRFMI